MPAGDESGRVQNQGDKQREIENEGRVKGLGKSIALTASQYHIPRVSLSAQTEDACAEKDTPTTTSRAMRASEGVQSFGMIQPRVEQLAA